MDHLPSWSGYYPRIDQINGRDGLGASLHLARRASSLRSYVRIGFPADSSNRVQIPGPSPKNKRALKGPFVSGGEGGIRTHEGQLTLAGFQDQCIQPLCHLSELYFRSRATSALTRCIPAPRPAGAFAALMRPNSFPTNLSTALPPLPATAHFARSVTRIQQRRGDYDSYTPCFSPK